MSSLREHLEEECNIDLDAELAISSERDIEYRGRKIEVFYRENACRWCAFVMGIGSFGREGEEESIAAARAAIDVEFAAKRFS